MWINNKCFYKYKNILSHIGAGFSFAFYQRQNFIKYDKNLIYEFNFFIKSNVWKGQFESVLNSTQIIDKTLKRNASEVKYTL